MLILHYEALVIQRYYKLYVCIFNVIYNNLYQTHATELN